MILIPSSTIKSSMHRMSVRVEIFIYLFILDLGCGLIFLVLAAIWPYNGKRYMQMFPPLQHPPAQHGAHMQPPVPTPMPPPSYEEDSAAQAAAQQQHRGYVYYPPYGYPPQVRCLCAIFNTDVGC
jgi:hypothetical protein